MLRRDGRLSAYVAVAAGVLCWTEREVGGPHWTGPQFHEAPGLRPDVSVTQDDDGFVQLFGVAGQAGAKGRTELRIVHATQYQSGRPLVGWRSLGVPFPVAAAAATGTPVGVADRAGGLNVFVHNHGHGIRHRRQKPTGAWSAWIELDARWVHEPVVAAATQGGGLQLLAPFNGGAVHWGSDQAAGGLQRLGRPALDTPPGSLTALETSPGQVTFYGPDAGGQVLGFRPPRGQRPAVGPFSLAGGGQGAPAAVRAVIDGYDCTLLAVRTPVGGVALTGFPTEGESGGTWWADMKADCSGVPAMALDAFGRAVLAVVSSNGTLLTTRQKINSSGLAFGSWSAA